MLRSHHRLPWRSIYRRNSTTLELSHTNRSLSESAFFPDPVIGNRATISLTAKDYPGLLSNALKALSDNDVNITRVESRYGQRATEVNFFLDVDVPYNHQRVRRAMTSLHSLAISAEIVPATVVPWFPITAKEVDSVALLTLDGGTDLEADHPGFHDQDYKRRRAAVTESAQNFQFGDDPMTVEYSAEEIACWATIWRKLKPLLHEHGCPQYLENLELLGYDESRIPQLADISKVLRERTGMRLRPTAGLLSSRHFLNGLAFNTFFCTQYLRHHSVPFYTPEPDVVHELVGHAPMFMDPSFAAFSQEIGLASIGATDEQIEALARCYWFSVEFGICEGAKEGERKVYGAGILSSYGELEYAMSDEPEVRVWDPWDAAEQAFPITKYQPLYYLAPSFESATESMSRFANSLDKPFTCRWNDVHEQLYVDRNVQRKARKENDFGEYIGDA